MPEPPTWHVHEYTAYHDQLLNGPRYCPGEWFGPLADYERMRYRRAIDYLCRGGLLQIVRKYGRRLSHIMLTPLGNKVAAELLAEQQNNGAAVPEQITNGSVTSAEPITTNEEC